MSDPVEGWDREAQNYWDSAPSLTKARILYQFAVEVCGPGNTRAHLLAAVRELERCATLEATVERLASVLRVNAQTVHQAYHLDSKGTWKDCAKDSCMSAEVALRRI